MYKQHSIPGFPEGAQKVCDALYIVEKDGWVHYFLWNDNYFSHLKEDIASRRFILASLMENGHVRASELEREPLLIPHRTLMNWKAQHRKAGPGSFLIARPKSSKRVMTPEKSAQCGALLDQGISIAEASRQAAIDDSTLRKAVTRGAVLKLAPAATSESGQSGQPGETPGNTSGHANTASSTKSERSRIDAAAADGIGTACTRADERIDTALGLATCATTRFEASCDVPMAGLLTALPALCANGLLGGLNLAYPVDCQISVKMLNWRHGPTRFSDDASRVSAGIPR